MDNLLLADEKARRGKRDSYGVRLFDRDREGNLLRLHEMLLTGEFHTSSYETFTIHEPKERVIYRLPYYPDRIVHHAIMNVLEPIWTRTFTYNTYSCIKGRGIDGCARRVERIIAMFEGRELYCLKTDIRKYYPSIRHDVLKGLLRRKIKDARVLGLIDGIIDSAAMDETGNPADGSGDASRFDGRTGRASLQGGWHGRLGRRTGVSSLQGGCPMLGRRTGEDGGISHFTNVSRGLPIGNYLSQHLSNLYLCYVMHWANEELATEAERTLGLSAKPRIAATEYADDIVFFAESKAALHEVLRLFGEKIEGGLGLRIKANWQIFPIAANRYDRSGRGLDYVGYVFYRRQKLLRKSTKKNMCRMAARLNGLRPIPDMKRYKGAVAPWLGWAKHCDGRNLLKKVIKKEYYESVL